MHSNILICMHIYIEEGSNPGRVHNIYRYCRIDGRSPISEKKVNTYNIARACLTRFTIHCIRRQRIGRYT